MDTTLFVVSDGSLPCDNVSCAIIPPLLLEYYEAKNNGILFVVFFSWKATPEILRYVEMQIFITVYMEAL